MPASSSEKRNKKLEEVKNFFADFLDTRQQRKSPDRFAILEEMYRRTEIFDIETLYLHFKSKKLNISRVTIKHGLELLVASGLIKKQLIYSLTEIPQKMVSQPLSDIEAPEIKGKVEKIQKSKKAGGKLKPERGK